MTKAEAIKRAMAQCTSSLTAVKSCEKEYAIRHDCYIHIAEELQPKTGRHSGSDLEDMKQQALAAYEALLDNIRIHRDNLAHLAVLKGKTR